MIYLFSLELILKVDPIEGLIFQVLLRIPQLLYNREKQTTIIRVSIMVLYQVVDPDRVGSASFCWIRIRSGDPGHANPDPADPDHYQFANDILFFLWKFQYAVENAKNYDIFDTDEKEKT